MQLTKRTFAALDVCPSCHGTFLDAGEGVAAFGPNAEIKFLIDDGRARMLDVSTRACANGHGPMRTFSIKKADGTLEIDLCEECGGFFLDAGEGEALASLDSVSASFEAAPPRSAHDLAIDEMRQSGDSFFERYLTDLVTGRARKQKKGLFK
jgi:Zn-finger nucleic acid-binding protein